VGNVARLAHGTNNPLRRERNARFLSIPRDAQARDLLGRAIRLPKPIRMSAELRILVIDDEIDSATSLTGILQSLGHRTTCAFGGDTGTRIAQLFRPHLIFLDLAMPGSGGCEVLSGIRRALAPEDEPMFVCLTGHSSEEAEDRCRQAGFHRFVRKPMPAQELLEILEEAASHAACDAAGAQAAHVAPRLGQSVPPQPA